MLQLLRVAIILTTPALFWLGWSIAPELISAGNMRYLGALFIGVWGLAFHFLRKSADLSSLPGLSGREQQRIVWKLAEMRRRVWWIGGISIVLGFLIWLVGAISDLSGSAGAPLSIGLLVGVGISYLVVLPGWFNELLAFADTLRLREDKKRRTETALKQIGDSKKSSSRDTAAASW